MLRMPAPILATKLFVPPQRAQRVHRRRLTDRLNATGPTRLTLVSAPAGFGKTTLLAEWAAEAGRPVAWLSLDPADGDPARFLAGCVSALQTVLPGLGASILERLESPEPPPAAAVLADLVNELVDARREITLVLDDYHIVDSRPVDAALAYLIDNLPPRMHVVVAAREDPQLPLARYRSRAQLAELREADLRFTPAEAAEFLGAVMGLHLGEQDVAALESRTEGWIVGLQLAALSMQGVPDSAAFIRSFTGTNRFVLDYLLEEVLHRQPAAIQEFLLGTSILDRMCGPLCDAVVGEAVTPGQETLEALDRMNLFVVPLDQERRWYRYHHLFAGLLRDRLATTRPDRLASLHQRASGWLAAHDLPEDAVRHALAGRDWTRAAELIERFSDQWPMRAGVATTLGWLESIPADIRLDRPMLGLTYAWNLFIGGQLDRAEAFLGQLAPRVAAEPQHLGEVFAVRLMVAANRGDMAAVESLADAALALVTTAAPSPRSRILISIGVARSDTGGDLDGAKRAFREAFELGRTVTPPSVVANAPLPVVALAYLAEIEWLQGNLKAAARAYDGARALAAQSGDQPSIALGLVHLGRANLLYERDDLTGAGVALAEGIRIGESWRNPRVLVPALGLSAALAEAQGRREEARASVERAATMAADVPPTPLIHVAVAVPQLALAAAEGDRQVVARWQAYFDTEAGSLPARIAAALAIALGRAWLALLRERREASVLAHARALVDTALTGARREGLQLHVTRLGVLDALVLHEEGRPDAAAVALAGVLATAAPEDYQRTFLDLGEPVEALLRHTLRHQALREPTEGYARRLLSRFRSPAPSEPRRASASLPIEPLTSRELDVLRLIAEGLSNREIGERLFLALSTVKGHARIVFDKLGVRRRTEAVARARELGLV